VFIPKALRNNSAILPYSLFDFANSSFVLIIHAYLFPLYFKNVLMKGSPNGDAIWGSVFASSALLAAIIAPFVGAFADGRNRYSVFRVIAFLSFLSAILLGCAVGSNVVFVIVTFLIANVCFYLASNMYDSLLTIVAPPDQRPLFSGYAWGFGYVGGIICFLVVFGFQSQFGIASRLPYLITGLFYLIFGCLSIAKLRPYIGGNIRAQRLTVREILMKLDRPRATLLLGTL
jgi:MFS-type transporter involved in bile tolerance (Atg22 family)